jgi:hypothetical protein
VSDPGKNWFPAKYNRGVSLEIKADEQNPNFKLQFAFRDAFGDQEVGLFL